MSLNRYEQALFDYWERHPDESRHWRMKILEASRAAPLDVAARTVERELWNYFIERCEHVPALRNLNATKLQRISMRNLADLAFRLWGPVAKPKRTTPSTP